MFWVVIFISVSFASGWMIRDHDSSDVISNVFISLLVFVCIVQAITLLNRGEHGTRRDTTTDADNEENDPDRNLSPTRGNTHDINADPRTGTRRQQHNYERRIANWTIVVGCFTGLLFVATGLSAWFLYQTDDAIHGQLREAREQTITTHAQIRANMIQEDIGHELRYENGALVGVFFTPHWKNVGATDARDYVGWYRLTALSGKTNWTVADCPNPDRPADVPGPIVVQAGHPLSQEGQLLPIAVINQVLINRGAIFFAGHSQYRDIFPDDPTFHFDWCQRAVINNLSANEFSFQILRQQAN